MRRCDPLRARLRKSQPWDGMIARVAEESLAVQFLHSDLDVDCPACGYPVWVLFAEVVAQAAVLCPCCRERFWLRDAEGGAQTAGEVVERQIEQMLEGPWK